jgi:endonuclease/exonuclease/phosphatase family metal-dependent hydrolase
MRTRRLSVALLFLGAGLGLVLGPAVGSAPAGARSGSTDEPLQVLTFNIHACHGADDVLDLQRVERVIRSSGADVVGLQEVDRHYSARSDWVDQGAELAQRLDMHLAFGATIDEEPPAPRRPRVQFGNAILSRYPITSTSNTLLHLTPGQEQRGLLEAVLDVRGIDVEVFNTHLADGSATDRVQQATQIQQMIGTPERPTILVGDMNAAPGAPEITILQGFLTDTWAVAGEGPGYTFESTNPAARVDYVFTSDAVPPVQGRVVSTDPVASDHLPVAVHVPITSQDSDALGAERSAHGQKAVGSANDEPIPSWGRGVVRREPAAGRPT